MNDKNKMQIRLIAVKWSLLIITFLMVLFSSGSSAGQTQHMVQTVLLEQWGEDFVVGVIYAQPQAAADSAKAQEKYILKSAKGDNLAQAFAELNASEDMKLSYDMVEFVLLTGRFGKTELEDYAKLISEMPFGSLSASVSACETGIIQLEEFAKGDELAVENILNELKLIKTVSPRLYQSESDEMVLPIIGVKIANVQTKIVDVNAEKQLLYISNNNAMKLSENESKFLHLLQGKSEPLSFECESGLFTVQERIVSLEKNNDERISVLFYGALNSAQDSSKDAIIKMEQYLEEELETFISEKMSNNWDILGFSQKQNFDDINKANVKFFVHVELYLFEK